MLMEDMPVIPIYIYTSNNLVNTSVKNFNDNILNQPSFKEIYLEARYRSRELMLRFALNRLLQAIPVLLIVISATFLLVHSAPGGPFSADKAVPPEVIKALEAQYNLDQPLWQQYVSYLGDVQGDFGPSFKYSGTHRQ